MDNVKCRNYFVIQLAKDRAGFSLQSLLRSWSPLLPNPTENIPTYSDPLGGVGGGVKKGKEI